MERNLLVDKLKGYACFLVLFGHVIMGIRLAGINIPSFFKGIELFLWSFHVALFLFLSGVVYKETGEWHGKKTKFSFITHKLLNLGVPYIVFSVVYILINTFVGEANTNSSVNDVLNIWKTPIAQYWFLYALFFLFVIWTCASGYLKNWQTTIIVLLVGYLLPLFNIGLGSFDIVFYSALAFGVGTFVDFKRIAKLPIWSKVLVIILHIVISVSLICLGKIESAFFKEFMILLGIYSSILFISLLEQIKCVSKFLLFVNKYSLQIYLLHTIFTAGIRIIMLRLNVTFWWAHIIIGTACGLFFSILAAVIAEKIKFLNFVFFPTKTLKSFKKQDK